MSSKPIQRAVAYFRSARRTPEGSIKMQRDQINKFIDENKIVLIHEEIDDGVSGHLTDRPGLKRLLNEWICNPAAPAFDYVLLYDISRWGRFIDPQIVAHYERLCEQNSKTIVYVANGFKKNVTHNLSHLQTSIERFMAANLTTKFI